MQADEIVYLVPTRGRPGAMAELMKAWYDTGAESSLVFCVDDDDPELDAYNEVFAKTAHNLDDVTYMIVAPRMRLAGTLNFYAKHFAAEEMCKAIGFMGDDHRPRTKGWDKRFAECLSGGAGIVYGNDLLMGAKMPTAVCMTSDIPRALDYMCPPGMVHLCLDLVWKDWGEGMNRITYLDDVIIEHMHPANGKAKMDAGYTEVNSTEQVSADTEAYFAYKADFLEADLDILRELP